MSEQERSSQSAEHWGDKEREMEVNSLTRKSFPSGGQRLRKAPAPLWQGQIIERHESSPLPIIHVLRIGIRVASVSQEVRGMDRHTTGSCYYNKR